VLARARPSGSAGDSTGSSRPEGSPAIDIGGGGDGELDRDDEDASGPGTEG